MVNGCNKLVAGLNNKELGQSRVICNVLKLPHGCDMRPVAPMIKNSLTFLVKCVPPVPVKHSYSHISSNL